MSPTTTDPVDDIAQPPTARDQSASADVPTFVPRRSPLWYRLLYSTAVWALYVPHLAILRVLGPRLGSAWARVIGRFHWALCVVGAQRTARNVLEKVYPQFQSRLKISAVLRKHLELKHECFVRHKVFNCQRNGRRSDNLAWEVDPAMAEKLEQINASENGLILVGFHFGFFRLSATALPTFMPGRDAVHVSHRMDHYAGETIDSVAQLALRNSYKADKQSGARIHYVGREASVIRLYRLLAGGGTVILAADGACAKDFVDVPFLGGRLRMPCGWARLAAVTKSNVLILLDTEIDRLRRKVWLFDDVQLHGDDSHDAIYAAVAETARILERFVSREPWAWHPWQRIRCECADDGTRVLVLTELGGGNEECGNGRSPGRTLIYGGDAPRGTNASAARQTSPNHGIRITASEA